MLNKLIDKILTEWSYRVYDGMPNIKNPVHLIELKNSLKHLKINEDAIDYLMNRLYENEGEKLVKNPNPGTQRKNMVTLAYAKTFYKDKGVNVDDMSDDQIAKMADTDSKKGTPDDTEKTDDKKLKELEHEENAIKSFRLAIKFKKNYAQAYFSLGHIFFERSKYNEALQNFYESYKINPKFIK